MKNLKFIIISVTILAMGFFTSCKSDEDSENFPVAISFENASAVDSVYDHETFVLKGKVDADGPIQKVQFFRSFPFITGQDQTMIAGTTIYNPGDTCSFAVPIKDITYQTVIKVVVTQENGHQDVSSFTINNIPMNINSFSGIILGGWNSNYGSCLDAETGTMLSGGATTDPALAPLVDGFFDDAKLASTDLDSVYYDVNRLPDTGMRYNTTTLTAADFDKIKSDVFFKNYTAPFREVAIKEGDVVFFITKGGKKGLIKIISMTEPQGDLLIDEKIQK